ncbi:acyl-CoA dehydrogenase family protein [Methylopila musalis]|uniref:Acyl-CoA dehydrogenase family protein n=1 Tax=Methylopila musalis TaxID=1134781 RepID=A0ABW3Z7E8_9HYPH
MTLTAPLPAPLTSWLDQAAAGLDTGAVAPGDLLPRLAAADLFRIGAPEGLGGAGGTAADVVEAIAAVSERSLAAGFVFWGHRAFIEYLLQSPNAALRDRLLPDLLDGRIAGATGLSNAMKFLAGLEELQVSARADGDGLRLDGKLPWVTNLRAEGFHVAAAVAGPDGRPFVASVAYDRAGVTRSPDLDLIALRSTSTAALKLDDVAIGADEVIASDALDWCPKVRPAFLGFQIGMSIGLARRALAEAREAAGAGRHALGTELDDAAVRLQAATDALRKGLADAAFVARPADLFRIRIALAEVANDAVGLELQASGGKCYLTGPGEGFARRWREAAFLPVITPSLVQLKAALAAQGAPAGRAA